MAVSFRMNASPKIVRVGGKIMVRFAEERREVGRFVIALRKSVKVIELQLFILKSVGISQSPKPYSGLDLGVRASLTPRDLFNTTRLNNQRRPTGQVLRPSPRVHQITKYKKNNNSSFRFKQRYGEM